MSEKEDRNTIEETAPAAPDINEETGLADGAGAADDMDLEEAAVVAKLLAKMMVSAEKNAAVAAKDPSKPEVDSWGWDDLKGPALEPHVLTEEDLLAAEAAEQAKKKTFTGRLRAAWKKFVSVISPDDRKMAIPAFIAEIMVLAILLIILGRYSHVAPPTPTEYAEDSNTDIVKCLDGVLIVNGVRAQIPDDGSVHYSISYAWAEDDTDYPSVPHAIVASYTGTPEKTVVISQDQEKADDNKASDQSADGGDKIGSAEDLAKDSESGQSDSAKTTDDSSSSDSKQDAAGDKEAAGAAPEDADAKTLYEISLYKDSFTAEKDIPEGKNDKNWFADWATEQSEDVYKFPHKVGNVRGFCISTMDSKSAPEDYRTYTYYFAVPEKKGISIYVLEGTCYDPDSTDAFSTIIKNAINSINVNIEET